MTHIDVFYQGEGIGEIGHFQARPGYSFAIVKLALIEKHGLKHGTRLFLEDSDAPVDEWRLVDDFSGQDGVKIHLHRCRHVLAMIDFGGDVVRHRFGPGTTVGRVRNWAAERKFGMTPDEAGGHVLQISRSRERPALGVHLGVLASGATCSTDFELVPREPANGAGTTSLCPPDEWAFRADIAKPAFLFAEANGRWRLDEIAWPFAYIAVAAADGREYLMRLDCSGYPRQAPRGGLWDRSLQAAFDRWSHIGRAGTMLPPDWRNGAAPWHNQRAHNWHADDGINQYLELIWDLLNGADSAAA